MTKRRIRRDTPIYEALYEEIRRREITQLEAAIELGVSKQVIHNWLTARHVPSDASTFALAKFLHVTPSVVKSMTERARNVDRLAETERVQRETLETLERVLVELARMRAALRAAGLSDEPDDPNGSELDGAPARSRRVARS